LTPKLHH